MKLRFTALSINSIDMNTVMMFLRNRNPATPNENKTALRMRYQESGTVVGRGGILDLFPCEHDGSDDGDQNQNRGNFERQQVRREQGAADFLRSATGEASEH